MVDLVSGRDFDAVLWLCYDGLMQALKIKKLPLHER